MPDQVPATESAEVSDKLFKYKASSWIKPAIERLEILSESEKMVMLPRRGFSAIIHPSREKKESEGVKWCDTWQEAHDYLREGIKDKIARCSSKLNMLVDEQALINEMKPE